MADQKKGVVLLVHGSRDPSWLHPFQELIDELSGRYPGVSFALACLQFCSPSLEESIEALANEGIQQVLIVPAFISSLGHVTNDVPAMVEAARNKFPDLRIELSRALGEEPEVKGAFKECLARLAENL